MAVLAQGTAFSAPEPAEVANLRLSGGLRLSDELRLDALRQRAVPRLGDVQAVEEEAAPSVARPDTQDRTCLAATALKVEGATLIPPDLLGDWLKATPVHEGCIAVGDVNRLLFQISSWYMQRGYITSQPVSFEVDGQGTLVIQVLQGRLDKFESSDPRLSTRGLIADPGAVLNLRDIEQAVAQINRLDSRRVAVDIEPGESAGTSTVKLRPQGVLPDRDWFMQASVDTFDADQINGTLELSMDNQLGRNENIYVSHSRELNRHEVKSRSYSALISVPHAYSTYTASLYHSDRSAPLGLGETVYSDRSSVSLKWDRVLHRTQATIWSTFVDLSHDVAKQRIGEFDLRSPSWNLAHVTTGVAVEHQGDPWAANLSLQVDKGLGDRVEGDPRPHFDYTASNLQARVKAPIGSRWSVAAQVRAQHSADYVPGLRQFWVGGTSLVPGFRRIAYAGNSGAITQLNASYLLPAIDLGPDAGGPLGHMVSLLHTTGWIFSDAQNNANRLSSATLSYSAAWRAWSVSLAWSVPLLGARDDERKSSDITCQASFRY